MDLTSRLDISKSGRPYYDLLPFKTLRTFSVVGLFASANTTHTIQIPSY
jgi:hypothetical protein